MRLGFSLEALLKCRHPNPSSYRGNRYQCETASLPSLCAVSTEWWYSDATEVPGRRDCQWHMCDLNSTLPVFKVLVLCTCLESPGRVMIALSHKSKHSVSASTKSRLCSSRHYWEFSVCQNMYCKHRPTKSKQSECCLVWHASANLFPCPPPNEADSQAFLSQHNLCSSHPVLSQCQDHGVYGLIIHHPKNHEEENPTEAPKPIIYNLWWSGCIFQLLLQPLAPFCLFPRTNLGDRPPVDTLGYKIHLSLFCKFHIGETMLQIHFLYKYLLSVTLSRH